MKIIISGVTGFVGAHMMRHFSHAGHEVIGLGRGAKAPKGMEKFGNYVVVDLTQSFTPLHADACIHCAGYANDIGKWQKFYDNNVTTTKNIFANIDTPIFINISSSSMYPLSPIPISEDDVDKAKFPSFYGKSKWVAEQYLKNNTSDHLKIISLRPRAIYGTHDRVLLPRIAALGKSGKLKIPGDGRVNLSMTHIDNLIHATQLSIDSNLSGFHYFNVSDEQSYLLRTVFSKIISGIEGTEIPVQQIPKSLVKAIISFTSFFNNPFPLTHQAFDYITKPTIINIDKIKSTLGYREQTNFEKALPALISWANSIGAKDLQKRKSELPWLPEF